MTEKEYEEIYVAPALQGKEDAEDDIQRYLKAFDETQAWDKAEAEKIERARKTHMKVLYLTIPAAILGSFLPGVWSRVAFGVGLLLGVLSLVLVGLNFRAMSQQTRELMRRRASDNLLLPSQKRQP
jgi:hypothetical protein